MAKKAHLPLYGVGPYCVASMVILLLIGIWLWYGGYLASGNLSVLCVPFRLVGVLFVVGGIWIWIQAVIVANITKHIENNQLFTSGIYLWVRNPIYVAIAMALTGIALWFANMWLLVLPFLYWLDITVCMKCTEEKWLTKQYGQSYLAYCKKVHRCIPWFPKK